MAARFLFWTVILLFLSQNCGPQDPGNPNESASLLTASQIMGDVDMDRSVTLNVSGSDLELDLASGEVLSADNADWEGLCLDSNKVGQIYALLSANGICRTDHQYPEDTQCTMQYVYPYLQVFVNEDPERTPLGEESSGCPDVTIHLCSDDEDENPLKDLILGLDFSQDFGECSN